MAQRVEYGDSSAHEWGRLGGGQIVGHRGDGFCLRNHVFGIASIEVDGGDLFELAEDEVSAAARVALEAVSAVPSHADPLTRFPQSHVRTDGINASGNFMAWYPGILNSRPESFFHQRVTVADTASLDFDAYLG